jgi:hypothetical protein
MARQVVQRSDRSFSAGQGLAAGGRRIDCEIACDCEFGDLQKSRLRILKRNRLRRAGRSGGLIAERKRAGSRPRLRAHFKLNRFIMFWFFRAAMTEYIVKAPPFCIFGASCVR